MERNSRPQHYFVMSKMCWILHLHKCSIYLMSPLMDTKNVVKFSPLSTGLQWTAFRQTQLFPKYTFLKVEVLGQRVTYIFKPCTIKIFSWSHQLSYSSNVRKSPLFSNFANLGIFICLKVKILAKMTEKKNYPVVALICIYLIISVPGFFKHRLIA